MNKVKLSEVLHPKMDILFVALNAPEISNSNERFFSGSLSFWNLLYDAGLITQRIGFDPCNGEELVFGNNQLNFKRWQFGVTDLNKVVVETSSAFVKTNHEQVNRILNIVNTYEVNKLCLVHSKVARQFEKAGLVKRKTGAIAGYGIIGAYQSTPIYEMPFHCASKPNKPLMYSQLKGD